MEQTSDFVFTGHEHESGASAIERFSGEHLHYIEGAALKGEGGVLDSAFNVLAIDVTTGEQRFELFRWNGEFYSSKDKREWTPLITGNNHPAKDEVVTVDYTGWTTDGKMFDSSVARGRPATLPVNRLIPGFGEGIQMMVTGETRRLWIPQSLAYKGQQGRPAGTLVFDVTLRDMPTRAPADVKAPPADAKRTSSGLAYKVLTPGTGTRHPKKIDEVTVHYTGWTTDGSQTTS